MSHSLRSAWIEIENEYDEAKSIIVAHLTECVDRNTVRLVNDYTAKVALLTECVDRNRIILTKNTIIITSHSLRSAWIEIELQIQEENQLRCRTPYGVRG